MARLMTALACPLRAGPPMTGRCAAQIGSLVLGVCLGRGSSGKVYKGAAQTARAAVLVHSCASGPCPGLHLLSEMQSVLHAKLVTGAGRGMPGLMRSVHADARRGGQGAGTA